MAIPGTKSSSQSASRHLEVHLGQVLEGQIYDKPVLRTSGGTKANMVLLQMPVLT